MAMNPYTLAHLCEKGILNPADVMMATAPTPTMSYLDMAQQGSLYHSHGTATDSFCSNYSPAYTPQYPHGVTTGANYRDAHNGVVEVGSKSNAGGFNAFSGYGVGTRNNNTTFRAFGEDGTTGTLSNTGFMNPFGTSTIPQNNASSGFNRAMNIIDRIPRFVWGILAGTIGITSIIMAFKSGKKVPVEVVEKTSFWSKIKPKWLGKKK